MPYATGDDLIRARRVWQWVVAFVAVGQGLQYALNPAFPLAQTSYASLSVVWGEDGWLAFGSLLALAGVGIVLLPVWWRWVAHGGAAFCYLLLACSQIVSGTVPFVLLLAISSHVAELVLVRLHWNRVQTAARDARREAR